MTVCCKDEKSQPIKEFGHPLEAVKRKKTDTPLEPPEGTKYYTHCDFSPVRPISDFFFYFILFIYLFI
jgi:hypothetical protein